MVFHDDINPLYDLPIGESAYFNHGHNNFHLGARISPVGLIISNIEPVDCGKRMVSVTTEIVRANMIFPQNWLHRTINAENIKPFININSKWAIIPVNHLGQLRPHQEAIENEDWNFLNQLLRLRGRCPYPSLIENMHHSPGLLRQLPLENNDENVWTVLYSATGNRMKACRLRAGLHIIRDKLVYRTCIDPREAAYLVAIFNAPVLEEIFNTLRENEGYYGKYPLRFVPIPEYNPDNGLHRELAQLTEDAEDAALQLFLLEQETNDRGYHLQNHAQRNEELGDIYAEIDITVEKLFCGLEW